ncbi:phosphoadenosine phosphosulfate reductase [Streptomyces sp. V3I7]|uniref:phosphoadenosine phosphosulfate reductase n=1 Tax=Streptomyces sp. V3I7 TaxID=3042278 RepID=UPI00278A041F|nr:phosphoadenosine phosphosulfate reductase [Streptomyces sp. V3I7]MDQ0994799.1 3'-phosphoadenosine 5'-phosphosulfate sulfotransferase (PAPS reductase)/FAD synthetase [Streptomyces sp. V3I7]
MSVRPTVCPSPAPDLAAYDLLAPQLSGGKDSSVMLWSFMRTASAAGVMDRVTTYHASLGTLEWPAVTCEGTTYPSVSQLAAAQSAAQGIPAHRHVEVARPFSLLAEIASYGRFPRLGSPYCRKYAKESIISSAWTPMVRELRRQLGRPVRILKVMGLRADESRDRADRPAYRNVLTNGARIVDEWMPVQDWPTAAVLEWHQDAPVPHHWTYDSHPGAGDWKGTSRCSCSLCVFASKRDLVLAVARRPRLADLYAEVEAVRGDTFRPDWRIAELIEASRRPSAPDPGIICADDGTDMDVLEQQVRRALQQRPRKSVHLAAAQRRSACDGCT